MQKNVSTTIGFIGTGNMGAAILSKLVDITDCKKISIFDIDPEKTQSLADLYSVNIAATIEELIQKSEYIVLAIKPQILPDILNHIKNIIEDKVLISIAAGISIAQIVSNLKQNVKVIRVMPNTPSLVGEGMSVLSTGENIDEETLNVVKSIFIGLGRVLIMAEKQMDAVTAVSGSGPAYVFTFIQALIDAGVKLGIPRAEAGLLAAQTVYGASKMVLEQDADPITLRNGVTSPGGTTIDAVHVLERAGFSGIVIDAVQAAFVKSKKLGEA